MPDFLLVSMRRIKPFHQAVRYGYAVGRIRVLETQLINRQRIERLVEADLDSAFFILDEMPVGDHLQGAETVESIEKGLTAYLRGIYASVETALPRDSLVMDYFLCRYDFHNLKALLKGRYGEGEPSGVLDGLGKVSVEALKKGIENPTTLPSHLKAAVDEFGVREPDPQQLDTIIDRHYLSHRLFLAVQEGSPFMIDFSRASIDLANIKQVLRARRLEKEKAFVADALVGGGFVAVGDLIDLFSDPYEVMDRKLETNIYYALLLPMAESRDETVRLTDFDRRGDDRLMDMLIATKKISVGVEPVFAFLRAAENEVLTVRMILIAKLHDIGPDSIEKMLRKLYIE